MLLFDSHCHWDFPVFDDHRDRLLQQCFDSAIAHLMIPAVCAYDWPRLIAHLGCRHKVACWGALGLHPCFMQQHREAHLAQLDAQLDSAPNEIKAVGEIGLDGRGKKPDYQQQCHYFTSQLSIAASHRLPVLLHGCKAHDEVLKYLRRQQWAYGGIVHAFSGSLQQARRYQDLGFMLGIGGAVTYPKAQRLARMVANLPECVLVLETDAPDMTPSFAKHQHNSPIYLPMIANHVAKIRGQNVAALTHACTINTGAVLQIPV